MADVDTKEVGRRQFKALSQVFLSLAKVLDFTKYVVSFAGKACKKNNETDQ